MIAHIVYSGVGLLKPVLKTMGRFLMGFLILVKPIFSFNCFMKTLIFQCAPRTPTFREGEGHLQTEEFSRWETLGTNDKSYFYIFKIPRFITSLKSFLSILR